MSGRCGRGCSAIAALGARATCSGAEKFLKGFCFFFRLGEKKIKASAAARTCGVKKEGLHGAGWLQHSGVLGKAGIINRVLI